MCLPCHDLPVGTFSECKPRWKWGEYVLIKAFLAVAAGLWDSSSQEVSQAPLLLGDIKIGVILSLLLIVDGILHLFL